MRFTLSAGDFLRGLIATYATIVKRRTKFAYSELCEVCISSTAGTLVIIDTSNTINIKSATIHTSTLVWIFYRDTFWAIILRNALQATRISIVARLATTINIQIVADGAGQAIWGVTCVAVWEFESASSAKFSLGILVIRRLAFFTDVNSGTAQTICVKFFTRNTMIIFTQIITSYTFGAF